MTSTPKSSCDDILGESWVELSGSQQMPLQLQLPQYGSGPQCGGGAADEYIRLLREAQRESNNSSARVSLASSRHLTPRGSPKSPPNSPNTELSTQDDLPGVFINYSGKEVELERTATDWIWDWSSRPDQLPPKDWKFKHPKRKTYSIRQTKIGKNSLFSKEVLYTVFITNVITLLLGTGVGMWLSRRGFLLPRINIE